MTTLANYKWSDTDIGIKRYEGEDFCVVVNNNDAEHKVSVWQRGYPDALYSGPCFDEASKTTSLDLFGWFALLNAEPEYAQAQ